jgi:dolichol-phosphate mannosyltransferase
LQVTSETDAATAPAATPGHGRLRLAVRRRANWMQLAKFATVGASGYVVNLAVFSALVLGADVNYLVAAVCSFLVAVTNNYAWNRVWTFRHQRGSLVHQGAKFLAVSTVALAANLVVLRLLVAAGLAEVPAQAIAIVVVTPWNFAANKLWSFRRA